MGGREPENTEQGGHDAEEEFESADQGGQDVGSEEELPKELVQDGEAKPASFEEARNSEHALMWDKAMSAEFQGLI